MKVFNKDVQVVKPNQVTVFPNGAYAIGNLDLLKESQTKFVSVAGSRKITEESRQWLKKVFTKIPDKIIVSGLALGTDACAHKLALKNNNPTIAILPSGVGNITPKTNIPIAKEILKNNGLIISEYPTLASAKRNTYIERNQIIANLGNFLIMPQCDRQSGTMHTCRFNKQYNKMIVLPNHNYSGNQYLIHNYKFRTCIY